MIPAWGAGLLIGSVAKLETLGFLYQAFQGLEELGGGGPGR